MWRAALRPAYHRLYRLGVRTACVAADLARPRDLPPAMLRYRVSESLSIPMFRNVGLKCAMVIEESVSLGDGTRVLDFGCGCGRTLRWMIERHPAVDFTGVDCDAEAIDWCRAAFPRAAFHATQADPPLPFTDHSFDAVYCISVFTHLDEAAQDRWLRELARVLKPGGRLLLTIHGAGAAQALGAAKITELQERGFFHTRSRKLDGIMPAWYQTSWHTAEYMMSRMAESFEAGKLRRVEDGTQDVLSATRR